MQLTIIYIVAFGTWHFIAEDLSSDAYCLGQDYACQDSAVAGARKMTGIPHLRINHVQEIYEPLA